MGRPSKLTAEQWAEVHERSLSGESGRALAREFKLAESTMREHLFAHRRKLQDAVNLTVSAAIALGNLPITDRLTAQRIAERILRNTR